MKRSQQEPGVTNSSARPRCIWLTLEESDIIELKQVAQDRDVPGAVSFFQRVVAPRVRVAAQRRGIPIKTHKEDTENGSLPG